ncbi:MAG TPA: Ig-like domain-containing protein [Gemmatimonadales bacterium]|nr:Ig-like domain-containing protein [Gemmatimonadales bacterium]
MITKQRFLSSVLLALGACSSSSDPQPLVPSSIKILSGNGQSGRVGSPLPDSLRVEVTDAAGNGAQGVGVSWSVLAGGGSIAPSSSVTNASGVASAAFTLGPAQGEQRAQAEASAVSGSPVVVTATGVPAGGGVALNVASGGNNVPDRYSSDLWVHGNFAYTGTWGFRKQLGNVFNVWSLGPSGAPTLAGSVTVPDIGTVSDLQVSDDGQLLVVSGERGDDGGIYAYSLADPAHPAFLDSALVGSPGFHTVTLATISGRNYAFAARNPGFSGTSDDRPALVIYDVTQPSNITRVAVVPVPPNYGIHDTYVRDGLAFVFAWDSGVIIYDVGNGMRGGSPASPVEVSRLITAATSSSSPAVHNGWWFHNPVTGENRYLFIGQEGPGIIGSRSTGDIHVVDVSDLSHPVEVAFLHLNGAGTHNFWMDEGQQILYAAYYNAGVVALDVSGTLAGDLSARVLSRLQVGGKNNTFTWGVQLANGSLYAIDMLSGLWQLSTQ